MYAANSLDLQPHLADYKDFGQLRADAEASGDWSEFIEANSTPVRSSEFAAYIDAFYSDYFKNISPLSVDPNAITAGPGQPWPKNVPTDARFSHVNGSGESVYIGVNGTKYYVPGPKKPYGESDQFWEANAKELNRINSNKDYPWNQDSYPLYKELGWSIYETIGFGVDRIVYYIDPTSNATIRPWGYYKAAHREFYYNDK